MRFHQRIGPFGSACSTPAAATAREPRTLPSLELKIEGYSYEETSARTGFSIDAVKSYLQNGRRMLRLAEDAGLGTRDLRRIELEPGVRSEVNEGLPLRLRWR